MPLNPKIEVDTLEPPLSADFECRKLSILGHCVDRLFGDLQFDIPHVPCHLTSGLPDLVA